VFNIGFGEMLVLAIVGFVLIGPDKLPQLARDAGQMLRTLRDMAQGARSQLAEELPEEFRNFNPANLNPRTAIRNAILGDDDLTTLNPKAMFTKAFSDDVPKGAPSGPRATSESSGPGPTTQPAAQPPQATDDIT